MIEVKAEVVRNEKLAERAGQLLVEGWHIVQVVAAPEYHARPDPHPLKRETDPATLNCRFVILATRGETGHNASK